MNRLNKIKALVLVFACFHFVACESFLDIDESTGNDKETVYRYFTSMNALTGHLYSGLNSDFGNISGALRESATDNALYTDPKGQVYDIYNDLWSPSNRIDDVWKKYYGYIRSANSFLENFDISRVERYKYDPDYKDKLLPAALMYPNEVRILRAYYYFELIKRYGDVPLLTRTYEIEEVNTLKKSTFHEVVKYIVDECDQVAPLLPISHQVVTVDPNGFLGETGRVTRGTAMAIKARVLLYAASKLHNPTNDKEKWKLAAKASLDLIQSGWYSLQGEDADPLFTKYDNGVLTSKQLIFERRNTPQATFEQNNLPYNLEGISSGGKNVPSQNLVDIYEMSDGTPFDWGNAAHKDQPYFDATGKKIRDPRLYRNVKVNGVLFNYNKQKINLNTVENGAHYTSILGMINSGYYMNRYIDPNVNLVAGRVDKYGHHYALYRYAEVLLNYAEAAYEVFGSVNGTDAELTLSAYDAIAQVRDAAGMPMPALLDMDYIRDERRRELAFEDHRFWDLRRWKMGEKVKEIYGVRITQEGGNTIYTRVKLQDRVWNDKMYFYPFSLNENAINPNLTQNPGW
ncbi:RagB/SusD family nutrient uptake outer membrane protein [Halosquirtibacter xylanolyticus]|uniref:RagB/SusD family nutrient uptake outer membrane protein n=1 Tax=Halosquirtibacter xylanolyticus TaxID=3374599 RepID=UPI00374969A9|nr:RagB/SusD family nutrient uptake outer membrane protein [Prolixibacteraceae bacterium]